MLGKRSQEILKKRLGKKEYSKRMSELVKKRLVVKPQELSTP